MQLKGTSCKTNLQPLFLYLPFQSVHFPLEAPDEWLKLYANVTNKNRRTFSAMVSAMDDAIGRVVDALKEQRMFDDTIIIFSTGNELTNLLSN